MNKEDKISVIIVNSKRPNLLHRTLWSICSVMNKASVEVIFVTRFHQEAILATTKFYNTIPIKIVTVDLASLGVPPIESNFALDINYGFKYSTGNNIVITENEPLFIDTSLLKLGEALRTSPYNMIMFPRLMSVQTKNLDFYGMHFAANALEPGRDTLLPIATTRETFDRLNGFNEEYMVTEGSEIDDFFLRGKVMLEAQIVTRNDIVVAEQDIGQLHKPKETLFEKSKIPLMSPGFSKRGVGFVSLHDNTERTKL